MALVLTPNTSAICAAVRGPRFSESSSRAAYRNGCEMTRSICRVRTSNTSGRSSYRGAGCGPAGLPGFALRQGFSVFRPSSCGDFGTFVPLLSEPRIVRVMHTALFRSFRRPYPVAFLYSSVI